MPDFVGQRLGQYQVLERISRGATSTVYKAYQEKLDRFVAIKVLSPHFIDEEGFLERFRREARAVARLDHPNILPVYDYEQSGDVVYIVMKYVNTGTLKEMIGAPMDLRTLMEIVTQIGLALGYAHKQGVVHRDVKPSNILIGENNWALLTDFGLAKIRAAGYKMTVSGIGMGTPDYMAPEQAQGLALDGRADLYSLGVTLYEMATGTTPFDGDSGMAVVVKHITEPVRPPREINPDLPLAVEEVILKALAKDPNQRFQTAEALVAALARAVGPIGGRADNTGPVMIRSATDDRPTSQPARRINLLPALNLIRAGARRAGRGLLVLFANLVKWTAWVLRRLGIGLKRVGAFLAVGLRGLAHLLERLVRSIIRLGRSIGQKIKSSWAAFRLHRAQRPVSPPKQRRIAFKVHVIRIGQSIRTHGRVIGIILGVVILLAVLVALLASGVLRIQSANAQLIPNQILTATAISSLNTPTGARSPSATKGAVIPPISNAASPAGTVSIPGGSFTMGAVGGNFQTDETPAHVVTLAGFAIGVVEVTNAQFERFTDAAGYQTDAERGGDSMTWRSFNALDRQKFPVTYVSWNDAARFCAYYGGRLPTEAEWEYAARANTKQTYPWGNVFSDANANTLELGAGQPIAVASHSSPGPFGAYDVSGNVWEWVQDWYAADYYGQSPASNPTGPASGLKKVIRGGSFKTKSGAATTTAREQASVDGRSDDIGFRCVVPQ